jgi:uncharacterized protein YcbX
MSGQRQARCEAISQRRLPQLASVCVEIMGNNLKISVPDGGSVIAPVNENAYSEQSDVFVECAGTSTTSDGGWHLGVQRGKIASQEVNEWLNRYLNSDNVPSSKPPGNYVLVRSLSSEVRKVHGYAGKNQQPFSTSLQLQRDGKASPFKFQKLNVTASDGVKFQDMAPLHLASTASLSDLAAKMDVPTYPMECFRPNVVVTGNLPWTEEDWLTIQIGDVSFRVWKPCPRCTVPNRNPLTGGFQVTMSRTFAESKPFHQSSFIESIASSPPPAFLSYRTTSFW